MICYVKYCVNKMVGMFGIEKLYSDIIVNVMLWIKVYVDNFIEIKMDFFEMCNVSYKKISLDNGFDDLQVMLMYVLFVYVFLSGNICEVVCIVMVWLCMYGYVVWCVEVDGVYVVDIGQLCDVLLLGCWIDNVGCMLVEMKQFVVMLCDGFGMLLLVCVVVFGIGEI